MLETRHLLGAAALAAALAALPLSVSTARGVTVANACAQTEVPPRSGTCCEESGAICVIGEHVVFAHYFKREGPCKPAGPVAT